MARKKPRYIREIEEYENRVRIVDNQVVWCKVNHLKHCICDENNEEGCKRKGVHI